MAESRLRYEGDPTLARVMVRPQWLGALLLALIVAGAFAWLGQWQLGHAIAEQNTHPGVSEVVRPLSDLTSPGSSVTDEAAGMVVRVEGSFVADDFRVVEHRENNGETGAWVTGHLHTSEGGNLAVAIGWASDTQAAQDALNKLELSGEINESVLNIEGRYMPSDAAAAPKAGGDPFRITSMATAQMINIWAPFSGAAYPGYLVLHHNGVIDAPLLSAWGLDTIDSVAPLPAEKVNWLNVFYAAEWVIFAGFAVYLWYRLARDDWERIHELRLLQESELDPADPSLAASHPSAAGVSHPAENE